MIYAFPYCIHYIEKKFTESWRKSPWEVFWKVNISASINVNSILNGKTEGEGGYGV